jgi:hypothetical protein
MVASGANAETIFEWSSSTDSLTSYPIQTTSDDLGIGAFAPITIDDSGSIWIGLNRTLLRLNPQTGAETTLALPPVEVAAAGSGLPEYPGPPGQYNAIDSLVLDGAGDIVVSRTFATQLQSVDPSSFAVSDLDVPLGTVLAGYGGADLASDETTNGLAVVLFSASNGNELGQYVNGDWYVGGGGCPAMGVTYSDNELAVSGQDCVTLGSGGSGQSPEVFTESIAIQEIPYVGVFRLNNGVTVGGSTTGLTSIASGGQDTGISLGSVYSSPSVGASSNSYKVNGSSEPDTVLISPALIAPSGADQIWFVPAQGIAEVGLVDFS